MHRQDRLGQRCRGVRPTRVVDHLTKQPCHERYVACIGEDGSVTPDELRDRTLHWAHSLFYDEQPLPRLGLADLDLDAVGRYLDDTN
jgi:hypothetical protein